MCCRASSLTCLTSEALSSGEPPPNRWEGGSKRKADVESSRLCAIGRSSSSENGSSDFDAEVDCLMRGKLVATAAMRFSPTWSPELC